MTMIDRAALLDVLKAKCRERCPDGYDPAKCRNRCDAADEIALVEDAPAVVPDAQRWRDPDKDPPKVEENVLILFEKSEAAKVMAAVLPATIAVAGIGGWLILLFSRDRKAAIEKVLTSIGVLILTGFPLVLVALVYFNRNLPVGPVPLNIGARQLLFLILVTKAMDTGGVHFRKAFQLSARRQS